MDDLRLRSLAAREADAVAEAINGALKSLWTSMPAIIQKDSDGHVASVMSAIKLPIVQLDGTVKFEAMPVFDTSPVHYPGGGGVSHTHPVKKDDEGVVLFTSRNQDAWHQKGGVQDPVDFRAHHQADSRWFPGGRSDPRKLAPPPSSTSQQNRSDDGKHVVDVHPQNGVTHASTEKVLTNVGGESGSGTLHLPDKILKNAKKVLINCLKSENFPDPGASFANKKLIATKPVGAMNDPTKAISSIMSKVMSSGIGAVLSNPTAAAGGALSSSIATAATQALTAFGGGGAAPIIAALSGGGSGGLAGALGGLVAGASALSGATTPTGGAFGLSDLLSHAQGLTQFFGNDIPPEVSLSSVLAPLKSSGAIAAAEASLLEIIQAALSESITPTAAAGAIDALTSRLEAIMPAANAAITALQAAIPAMQLAQMAASMLGSLDPNESAVGNAIANPGLNALAAAVNLLFEPTAADAAVILAFPDQWAEQLGAQAGFAA